MLIGVPFLQMLRRLDDSRISLDPQITTRHLVVAPPQTCLRARQVAAVPPSPVPSASLWTDDHAARVGSNDIGVAGRGRAAGRLALQFFDTLV